MDKIDLSSVSKESKKNWYSKYKADQTQMDLDLFSLSSDFYKSESEDEVSLKYDSSEKSFDSYYKVPCKKLKITEVDSSTVTTKISETSKASKRKTNCKRSRSSYIDEKIKEYESRIALMNNDYESICL